MRTTAQCLLLSTATARARMHTPRASKARGTARTRYTLKQPPPSTQYTQSVRRTRERVCCRSAIGVCTPVTLDSSYHATPPARPAASGVPSKSLLRLSSDCPSGSRFLCHHLRSATTVLGEHSSVADTSRGGTPMATCSLRLAIARATCLSR